MARKSKWGPADRKNLWNMVKKGITESEIRDQLGVGGKPMSSAEFAQQLKMAMVESGKIKQQNVKAKKTKAPKGYLVTSKGRLTVSDFTALTGAKAGAKFTLEKPRGKSSSWRLVPVS